MPTEVITGSSTKTFKTENDFDEEFDYINYVLSQFIAGANPDIKPSIAFMACETFIEEPADITPEEAFAAGRAAYMEAKCNTPVNQNSH